MFDQALPLKTQKKTCSDSQIETAVWFPFAYELVKEPDFPSFRIGKRILVNRLGLQHWIDEQSSQPLSEPADTAA